MLDGSQFKILTTIPTQHARRAAELHFAAFEGKIGGILGRDGRGAAYFADIINPAFGLCAVSRNGKQLLGIAGFKTAEGALIGGEFSDLRKRYGFIGAVWRGLILSVLERDVEPDRLLMDGIAVVPAMRGPGVGSALLDAIVEEAERRGKSEVRLDVIDINPRARALYERKGFVAGEIQSLGPLKYVFGFKTATTMVKQTRI